MLSSASSFARVKNVATPIAVILGAMLIAFALWHFAEPHYQIVGVVGEGDVYRLNTRTGAIDPCWRFLAPGSKSIGLVCGDTSDVPRGSMIGR